jgi:hypothetical protein
MKLLRDSSERSLIVGDAIVNESVCTLTFNLTKSGAKTLVAHPLLQVSSVQHGRSPFLALFVATRLPFSQPGSIRCCWLRVDGMKVDRTEHFATHSQTRILFVCSCL